MWQRFSESARKVVFYAQEEAQRFGEGHVTSEHLLLGLLRVEDGTAARILQALGVGLDRVRAEVEKGLAAVEMRPSQDMTLTPRAKRVIDQAYREAREMNNDFIGTEHLLLGLIPEGDAPAAEALKALGVEAERVREEAKTIQAQEPDRHKRPEPKKPAPRPTLPPPDAWAGIGLPVRRAVAFAEMEALRRGQAVVSPEHLLLGLLEEPGNAAAGLLANLGLDVEEVRDAAWDACRDAGAPLSGEASLSAACEGAFRLAYEEQNRFQAAETGADHLLLGLLREPDGMAARVLEGMGVDADQVRIKMMALARGE